MKNILVVGAGAMGVQIAVLCALRGLHVTLAELDDDTRETARPRAAAIIGKHVDKGRATRPEASAALERLEFIARLDEVTDIDLAIEAVTEDREVKRRVLAELEPALPADALLASNSSSFVPSSLATDLDDRSRFLNIHFFNPVLSMRCVEIIAAPETSPGAVHRATRFVESLDKLPVIVKKEIPGFVANRILNAVRDEAIRLLEGGYADVESIDLACRHALGYPMGPFELMDLTGIDIGYLTKKARFEETGDPADAPSRTVTALVEQGTLGRKTGQGFYHYDTDSRRGAPAL
ncbi:3-hydroxyacyl-CoA dehydrogenase family protein [Ruicaihuangia caeni]|uniref:3-hydroxyacyl-CoA dehydrogenase family protein n=1 Tax=Ruicaihuangia caeni TaxID=3042517 RepID=A0AAW6T9H1_9MICO|nr:3-hydroxyacyl-CoA dehydrogenase family protein [Klugiella sp. YN-L-19]MDI2098710.1 3-hydroxyacyl-CoA dehydrogenase family protein [Klugiella sp. YN-L-19]